MTHTSCFQNSSLLPALPPLRSGRGPAQQGGVPRGYSACGPGPAGDDQTEDSGDADSKADAGNEVQWGTWLHTALDRYTTSGPGSLSDKHLCDLRLPRLMPLGLRRSLGSGAKRKACGAGVPQVYHDSRFLSSLHATQLRQSRAAHDHFLFLLFQVSLFSSPVFFSLIFFPNLISCSSLCHDLAPL